MVTTNDTKPTALDLRNVIDAKASQLKALLQNTYGESGESFRNLNDELQDNYMWACSSMAGEIVNALQQLDALKPQVNAA